MKLQWSAGSDLLSDTDQHVCWSFWWNVPGLSAGRRLTKEELERRSKENLLSEVGGKALEAEEQVKVLRQRIGEMEEQMRKTEEVYKEQVRLSFPVVGFFFC